MCKALEEFAEENRIEGYKKGHNDTAIKYYIEGILGIRELCAELNLDEENVLKEVQRYKDEHEIN
jgi:hypothetical protein